MFPKTSFEMVVCNMVTILFTPQCVDYNADSMENIMTQVMNRMYLLELKHFQIKPQSHIVTWIKSNKTLSLCRELQHVHIKTCHKILHIMLQDKTVLVF